MSTTFDAVGPNAEALALRNAHVMQRAELDVTDVIAQVQKIQRVMEMVMKKGDHYGVIPGTDKPTLLKPGAEKLCLTFRLDPQYSVTTERDGDHVTKESTCTLWHIPSGQRIGSGMGSCSTKESKYAYRTAKRVCPRCGMDAILKSKFPPRSNPEAEPGWYCFAKRGGCGVEYAADDAAIMDQKIGTRVANEDRADQYNTVLKMANKRSLIAAVLNATAASDIFTQDLIEEDDEGGGNTNQKPTRGAEKGGPERPHTMPVAGASKSHDSRGDGQTSTQPAREHSEAELVAEANSLFPDPQEDIEREKVWNEITRLSGLILATKTTPKEKQRWADDKAAAWTTNCGAATPETADLSGLNDLKKWLETRQPK